MEKIQRQFTWTLDRDKVEDEFGNIPLNEWIPFCTAFEEYFKLEARGTLQWLMEEGWEEIKEEYI